MTTIQILCQLHDINQGSVTIGLDGKSTFNGIQQPHPPNPQIKHYDIIMDIRRKIKSLPVNIYLRYVAGHQDKLTSNLDWWERQNVRMDLKAKEHMRNTMHQNNSNILIGQNHWTVRVGQDFPHNCDLDDLYDRIYTPIIQKYWCIQRQQISLTEWPNINWEACELAAKKLTIAQQRWLSKNHSGHCGNGKSMKIRQLQTHDECPLCTASPEDMKHVMRCPDPRAELRWEYNAQLVKTWMDENFTHPTLNKIIMRRLHQWHNSSPTPLFTPWVPPDILRVIQAQDTIGWYQFLLGRTHYLLADFQEIYLQSIGTKKTGLRWTQPLINKLWDFSKDMWEHRNHIKHNTITPQIRTEIEITGEQLQEQKTIGRIGMLKGDYKLISKIDKAFQLPLEEQKLWLQSIITARAAAQAHNVAYNSSVRQQRQNMARFLQS